LAGNGRFKGAGKAAVFCGIIAFLTGTRNLRQVAGTVCRPRHGPDCKKTHVNGAIPLLLYKEEFKSTTGIFFGQASAAGGVPAQDRKSLTQVQRAGMGSEIVAGSLQETVEYEKRIRRRSRFQVLVAASALRGLLPVPRLNE
jgi:hypothetical protein